MPLTVLNKIDRLESPPKLENILAISALTGAGIPELIEAIVARLIPEAPAPNEPVPFTNRQAAGLARLATLLEANDLEAARVVAHGLLLSSEEEPIADSQ